MAELFHAIHEATNDKLSDDTWCDAHDSAYEYLSVFAQENPVPNVRTAPAKTLLAAAYLAVLMVPPPPAPLAPRSPVPPLPGSAPLLGRGGAGVWLGKKRALLMSGACCSATCLPLDITNLT
jgi:hypothetical protein